MKERECVVMTGPDQVQSLYYVTSMKVSYLTGLKHSPTRNQDHTVEVEAEVDLVLPDIGGCRVQDDDNVTKHRILLQLRELVDLVEGEPRLRSLVLLEILCAVPQPNWQTTHSEY